MNKQMIHSTPARFIRTTAICAVLSFSLSGCAGIIVAGLTISELMTAGSIGSALITGKGLGEHALDLVTGQDCRILEAVFRKDRAICEPKDSPATEEDFKGLIALLDTPAGQDIQLADLPIGKDQLTAIDPNAKAMSNKVLTTLTGTSKTIQLSKAKSTHTYKSLAQLTQATQKFDVATLSIKAAPVNADPVKAITVKTIPPQAVAKTDLKKRLMNGLF